MCGDSIPPKNVVRVIERDNWIETSEGIGTHHKDPFLKSTTYEIKKLGTVNHSLRDFKVYILHVKKLNNRGLAGL